MSYHLGPAEPDGPGAADYGYDEPRPRRPLLRPLLLVVVMAAFAGGLWFAYSSMRGRSPGEVPLIRADDTATKARPDQPGGMAIPNQDKLVYGQGRTTPVVEKLLPPPETPLPRPVAPVPAAAPAPTVTGPAPLPGTVMLVAPAPAPDVAALAQAAPPPLVATPPAAPPAAPVVTTAAPPAQAATPAPVAAATAAAGGFRLQLAALRSEDAARKEWGRIKQANKDLLGAYGGSWPRADLGERGVWYRLQAGPVADGAAAERICNELKRRNVGCMLVRP